MMPYCMAYGPFLRGVISTHAHSTIPEEKWELLVVYTSSGGSKARGPGIHFPNVPIINN